MYVLMNVKTKALFRGCGKSVFVYAKTARKHAAKHSDRKRGVDIVAIHIDAYNRHYGNLTKKVTNLMSGKEIEISINTPLCCDPSSETYWSM